MKPHFTNAFGIARNANQQGRTVELQLDFMLQYMEGESQMTKNGPVSASVRKNEQLTSVLLTRSGVTALISLRAGRAQNSPYLTIFSSNAIPFSSITFL